MHMYLCAYTRVEAQISHPDIGHAHSINQQLSASFALVKLITASILMNCKRMRSMTHLWHAAVCGVIILSTYICTYDDRSMYVRMTGVGVQVQSTSKKYRKLFLIIITTSWQGMSSSSSVFLT